MGKLPTPSIKFEYAIPASVILTMPLLRKTLREVQAQLLSREINGGDKKLRMETTTSPNVHTCGMAACIGGWASLFLLGFDKTRNNKLEDPADNLFGELLRLDNGHRSTLHRSVQRGLLHTLFHDFHRTENYDEPNVAATAIQRYLANKDPWPRGEMPNVMPYTKRAYRKHK